MLEACGMRNGITRSFPNSKAAWASLKKNFPNWDLVVLECADDIAKIEIIIRVAGPAKTRIRFQYPLHL